MTPTYADEWLTLYGGDCRAVLREMEPESVHCVVTSPPYWGLRDYGTATWEGGLDSGCKHPMPWRQPLSARPSGAFHGGSDVGNASREPDTRDQCGLCGARRIDSQLGLEATPEEYVAAMVDVFREVRRVLRADGTLWLNLGDSYFGTGKGPTHPTGFHAGGNGTGYPIHGVYTHTSLKEKDLVGIPWRVAFALQADCWYLRSDIVWAKPNPMPESVTDRPTKSHEYLFLLSKNPRYYFDADAVREADSGLASGNGFNGRQGGARQTAVDGGNGTPDRFVPGSGRNIRSVWTIATAPYPGAHFATFPPKLVEPCIKAGCPSDGVVLDPFAGTGTVGMVAQQLSRRAVLIDLNPDYLRQCLARNAQTPLGLPA